MLVRALNVVTGHSLWKLAGPSAVRRVNPSVLFVTQTGKLLFVSENDGLENNSKDEFLRGLPPISSSSGCSTLATTPRGEARGSRVWSESEDESDIARMFRITP